MKSKNIELIETETRMVAGGWSGRKGEILGKGHKLKMNKFQRSNVQHSDYS